MELPTNIDPKHIEKIKGVIKAISDEWAIVDGYRAKITDSFASLAEETEVPARMLRKIATAYHQQTFQDVLDDTENFQIIYEKIFGAPAENS